MKILRGMWSLLCLPFDYVRNVHEAQEAARQMWLDHVQRTAEMQLRVASADELSAAEGVAGSLVRMRWVERAGTPQAREMTLQELCSGLVHVTGSPFRNAPPVPLLDRPPSPAPGSVRRGERRGLPARERGRDGARRAQLASADRDRLPGTGARRTMTDVIDLEAKRHERSPHRSGSARCLNCKHEWAAVAPIGVVALQCPRCETTQAVFKGISSTAFLQWQCACGEFLFFIDEHSPYCAHCGERPSLEWRR